MASIIKKSNINSKYFVSKANERIHHLEKRSLLSIYLDGNESR